MFDSCSLQLATPNPDNKPTIDNRTASSTIAFIGNFRFNNNMSGGRGYEGGRTRMVSVAKYGDTRIIFANFSFSDLYISTYMCMRFRERWCC